jgi:arylsulfatase A-like enzyme
MPAKDKRYIGSPSFVVLPNGRYIASHDIFGPGSKYSQTRIFESVDRGVNWRQIAEIDGAFWSTLFAHRGHLYLMGASQRYGDTVIRRSDDGGRNWTTPTDSKSGLLQSGGVYHCAPQPVLVHNGRIWRAMEDTRGGKGWGKHFRAFMMSAPQDADLLAATNWTISNPLARDAKWLDGKFNGWLEGNAVATPDGSVVNILRVDVPSGYGKAAIIEISDDGKTSSFDPTSGFFDMPGGSTKFTIRYDPQSQSYWSLVNQIPKRHVGQGRGPGSIRNTLALVRSKDLRHWQLRAIVAYHPEVEHHGFQYPDWQIDGDDIVAVSRTAYDDGLGGAHNYHDANFLTFHRIRDFRNVLDTDLPPLPSMKDQSSSQRSRSGANSDERPNVLFIAVDDLNDWTGCLGGHPQAKTPNIDRLADSGMLFTNAHCPAPACNPSRTAIMTGISPHISGLYENRQKMREVLPDAELMPKYFSRHGYWSAGSGKILHYFIDAASWDDYFPAKESENPFPRTLYPEQRPVNLPRGGPWQYVETDWGGLDVSDEEFGGDWLVSKWVGEQLCKKHGKPFFLACGIYRPHEPWFVPQQYFDRFPLADIQLPPGYREDDLDDLPPAGKKRGPNRYFAHIRKHGQWKKAIQGYLASIAFADTMIGRVIDALDDGPNRENTIVILWSDHGWHLGEKQHWQKFTAWRVCTRVPLIVRVPAGAPGLNAGTIAGSTCAKPVNLLSLFRTLTELTGLPPKSSNDGPSLVPLLGDPQADWPYVSLTHLSEPGSYGLSTEHWRLLHYANGDEELYDSDADRYEWTNLALQAKHEKKRNELRALAPETFAAKVRPSDEIKK